MKKMFFLFVYQILITRGLHQNIIWGYMGVLGAGAPTKSTVNYKVMLHVLQWSLD